MKNSVFGVMRSAFLLSIIWCAVGMAQEGPAQDVPNTISEVRVEGNEKLSADAILGRLKTRAGTTYDVQIIRQDEATLLGSGRYNSVQTTRIYTPEGVVVTFTVSERPLVSNITLIGNTTFSYAELVKHLPFGVSDPLNRFNVDAGREAILRKYQEEGFDFAEVTLNEEALQNDRSVIYTITEGPRVVLSKIRFEGNRHFSNMRLRRNIGSSARLWPFVTGYIDVEQLDRDVQAIRNLYLEDGYMDVQVGRLLEYSPDKTKATAVFVIEEGPRFRIGEITFEGNKVFSSEQLARRIELAQGKHYSGETLRLDTKKLEDTYGELGYINASVVSTKRFRDPTAEPPGWAKGMDDGKPSLVNLIFHIREQDQYHIGKIDIRGNTITQSRIIRRQLRFFPEQLYNTVAVDETKSRLMETRLFSKVEIDPVGSGPDMRDVLISVSEARTAEFLIGVGVSTNSGLLGNISFTQRNFDFFRWPSGWNDFFRGSGFKGAGQTLSIVAEPGTELMRFTIEWFEPYLFDQPYSLGAKAFVFTRDRDQYTENRLGGVVSLGHRFKNRWYGELASTLEQVKIDDVDRNAAPEIQNDAGDHFLPGVKGTLVRDRTDSRWMPSRGDRFRLSYDQVVGSYNFGRAVAEYRIYRTLRTDAMDRKHILSGRLMAGNIFGDAPVFEKFYGGGSGSIRGFKYRGISPRSTGGKRTYGLAPFDYSETYGKDDAIGGDFMFFAGTEYGFPLVGEQLRGVFFVDSGTVEPEWGLTTYRISAGVGIRWAIPLFGPVPLALDFAVPLVKDEKDDTQFLSFTFGWTF